MLVMHGISVSIGGKSIVSDISLTVEAGEFVVIIGPNGAGKSTLLKVISGEMKPTRGEVSINGIPVQGTSPARLAMHRAVLPQANNLSFPFTVNEVIRLGFLGGVSGVPPGETENLVRRALEAVDLVDFDGRFYQELSGGEKQRVQLARVLCQVWEPVFEGIHRFLILDEPTSSLDIRHQLAILELSKSYAEAGGGVVAVLHDLNVAAMFADRLVVISEGRIAADGLPGTVLTNGLVRHVFGLAAKVNTLPEKGMTFVLPQTAINERSPGLVPVWNKRDPHLDILKDH